MNAYERDPYRVELDVSIAGTGTEADAPYVLLDDTVLFPEGGGQPADHGWIEETAIIDVQRRDGEIRHYLEQPLAVDKARLRLDWQRRFDHMQQHTAQHLLTAIAADRFGWQTTAFHLGADHADIELDVASLDKTQLRELEAAVNEKIRDALRVTAWRVNSSEFEALEVRTRGLPSGHTGDVRLVEIAGVDRNTCGGTHLASTAEIETLVLTHTESLRGGTRLYWLAGARVREHLHRQRSRLGDLRRLFETSGDELLAVAEGKLERLKAAERDIKALRRELARTSAQSLAATEGDVIEAHFAGSDAGFLQAVARELDAAGVQGVGFLTAENEQGAFFLVCAPDRSADVRSAAGEVATLLEGRGGGSPDMVQGKAGTLARRPEAVALLLREFGADG